MTIAKIDYVAFLQLLDTLPISPGVHVAVALSRINGTIVAASLRLITQEKAFDGAWIPTGETPTYSGDRMNLENLGRFLAELAFVAAHKEQFPDFSLQVQAAFRRGSVCRGNPLHWGVNIFEVRESLRNEWRHSVAYHTREIFRGLRELHASEAELEEEQAPEGVLLN